ncbi:MAG: murein L,D-transpeptidase catalytic domain family protein [Bacteroidota bacterium]
MKRQIYSTFGFVLLLLLWSSFRAPDSLPKPSLDNTLSESIASRPSFAEALDYRVNARAIELAIEGYENLLHKGQAFKENLVVIDYSKSANDSRFYVIDMKDTTLLYSSLVAHGKNTGQLYATDFSNKVGSYKSSLGFFKTAETYSGKHGLSLRLDGLEDGINHKARERAIVIHSADYVSKDFIQAHGRLGRSHGCPALPFENYEEVIHSIKEGCLLFIYANQNNYASNSELLANY